jgi:hypothetical protein
VSNILRSIAEWLSLNLGYIVLTAFIASLGSLAFAVIQVYLKKKTADLGRPPANADIPAYGGRDAEPLAAYLSSAPPQRVGIMNAADTGFGQQRFGQGREQGPESVLTSPAPLKGSYGIGGSSQS